MQEFSEPVERASAEDDDDPFTGVDLILIQALGCGATHLEAAAMAEISTKSIQRRLKEPVFARAVAERRRQRVDEITGLLVASAEPAVMTLREIEAGGSARERTRAAQILLEIGRRYATEAALAEVNIKLMELQAMLDETGSSDPRVEMGGAS